MNNSMTVATISLLASFVLLSGCSQKAAQTAQTTQAKQTTPTSDSNDSEPSNSESSDATNLVINSTEPENTCDKAFFNEVERLVMSGDGQGHGPDIGSAEWQSVIEFKLGVRGEAQVPPRDTVEWCDYIKQQVATEIP